MPFKPFQKKSAARDMDDQAASDAPAFSKAKAFGKRKPRKAAPIQKSMMQSGRSMAGGGR